MEGTTTPFCDGCGKQVSADVLFCPECGRRLKASLQPAPPLPRPAAETSPPTRPVITITESKNPGIAALLALLVGIGVFGIGHIYVGRIGRGLVLLVVSIAIHVPLVLGGMLLVPMLFVGGAAFGAWFMGVVLLGLINLGLWIGQGYDAYKLAKQFNAHVEQYGKAPW